MSNMKKIIATLFLVAACATDTPTPSSIEASCGPAPVFPHLAAGVERLEGGRLMIAITTDTYGELIAYRQDAAFWQDCVTGASDEDQMLVRTVARFDGLGPAAEALIGEAR